MSERAFAPGSGPSRRIFTNATILDPEAAAPGSGGLLIEGERIVARLAPLEAERVDAERIDLAGLTLCPGFIDLHFHGSLVFCEPSTYDASLRASSASSLRHGTTTFLVTTVAWHANELAKRTGVLAGLVAESQWPGAIPIGIHLEGPWINPEAAGAQPRDAIRSYDSDEGREVLERAAGLIRMVTLAPEVGGAADLELELGRRGIVASLGHSLAQPATIETSIQRGVRHVTHLFNAMGPIHHRNPGVAGTVLGDDRLSCDLICDGAHVDPAMVRLAARAKREGLVLITDRLELGDPARDSYGSGPLHDDGTAWRFPDGRLGGSSVTQDCSLRNAQSFGAMTRLDAVAACSLRPARVLGIEAERGTLRAGTRADLVVLDDADRVRQTWIGGRQVFFRSPRESGKGVAS